MVVIYLFALLTMPADVHICDIWTRELTREAFASACPEHINASQHRADVYSVDMQFICSRPASMLAALAKDCGLNGTLDQYIIRIVRPAHSEIVCMVESASPNEPSAEEIAIQCPNAKEYTIQYAGMRETAPPAPLCTRSAPPRGAGLYEQAASAAEIATDATLPLLAERLFWYGFATREDVAQVMLAWQNQFDAAIYDAAVMYHVPARLLKRVMIVESSMWAFYESGKAGEIGMMQVTDNGLDVLMRWDAELGGAYRTLSSDAQLWARASARGWYTAPNLAAIHEHMPYYARLLAAYHCRALYLDPSLTGADAWRVAVIHYNGAPEYLLRIEEP